MGIAGRGCSTGRGPARHRPPPCRGHTAGSPPGRRCRVAISRFNAGQSEPWAHAVVLKPVSLSISSGLPPLVTCRLAGAAPARRRASAPSQTERRFSYPVFLPFFLLSARGEVTCRGGAGGRGGAAPHHVSICGRGDRRFFGADGRRRWHSTRLVGSGRLHKRQAPTVARDAMDDASPARSGGPPPCGRFQPPTPPCRGRRGTPRVGIRWDERLTELDIRCAGSSSIDRPPS